jgi:uncharacterized SAM-binding protein YcdF (DUF218 family)
MSAYAVALIGSFLLPPKVFLLPALAAWCLLKRRPAAARAVLGAMLACWWVFSMPAVGSGLLARLDRASVAAVGASLEPAGAIVLAAGGRHYSALEWGGADTADAESLERVREAVRAHRESGLPILITGGRPEKNTTALADLLSAALGEYGLKAHWLEPEAKNTAQNAAYTARILQPLGIRHVVLVTHGTHMPRAKAAFERAGFKVIARPVGLHHELPPFPTNFLPTAKGMMQSEQFFHEVFGLAWYRLTAAGR